MFNSGVIAAATGDLQAANNWYERATKAGHSGAMNNLGLLEKDVGHLQTAKSWWERTENA